MRVDQPTAASRDVPGLGVYLIVGLLAVAAFLPVLLNGFVWDDVPETFSLEYTTEWRNIPHFFTSDVSGFYRPLRSVVYLLGRTLFGDSPLAFHALSLLWHALASVAAAWLAFALTRSRAIVLATGALFAVHPVHTEAVAWITASGDALMAPLALLAAGLFVQARRAEPTSPAASRRLTIAAAAATLAACLAKESAAPLFIVVAFLEILPLPGAGRTTLRGGMIRVGAAAAATAVFFAARTAAMGSLATIASRPAGGPIETALASGRVAAEYARMMVLPYGLRAHWEVDFGPGPFHPATLGAAVLIAGLLAAAWLLRRRAPAVALGIVWFYVMLLPASNLVPLNQFASEKYLYLPSFGACLVLAWIAVALWRRAAAASPALARAGIGAGVVLLLVGGALSWAQARVWKTDVSLWTHNLEQEPDSSRARFQLARALWVDAAQVLGRSDADEEERRRAQDGMTRAEELLTEAAGLDDPPDPWNLCELGRIRMALAQAALQAGESSRAVGLRDGAREALEAAVAAAPEWERAHYLLGLFLAREGMESSAANHLLEARRLDAARGPRQAGPITATRFDPRLTRDERATLESALGGRMAPEAAPGSSPGAAPPAVAPAPPVGPTSLPTREEARAAIESALAARPGGSPAVLARTYGLALEAARSHPGLARDEVVAVLQLRLGWALGAAGDTGGSRRAYMDAVPLMAAQARAYPNSADVAFYHAEALAGAGRPAEARAELDRCVGLDPRHPNAPLLRQRLDTAAPR